MKARYNLILPEELMNTVKDLSRKQSWSILETLRSLIKYGLLMVAILNDPNAKLIVREGEKEREIIMP